MSPTNFAGRNLHAAGTAKDFPGAEMRLSSYHSHLCGILFSGHDVWHLHEDFRLRLLVSHAHEPGDLRRQSGICGGKHAACSLRAHAGPSDDADDSGRHLFYGIAMLDKFRAMGWKKPYLIFGMCDETFSINCTAEIPEDVDRGWFYFFVTLLNQIYWVLGATAGGLVGGLIRFNTEGLDFVMTAMFVVIFLEQWRKEKRHDSAAVGMVASVVCLGVFGAENFLIPTMVCILAVLTALRRPLEQKEADAQ